MSVDIAADPPEVTGSPDPVPDPRTAEAVAAAEAVLARRFGSKITLTQAEDLGGSERSVVLRVRVANSPFALPKTLVIKRDVTACDSLIREAASYQLFTPLSGESRMCPELFAHDADAQLL